MRAFFSHALGAATPVQIAFVREQARLRNRRWLLSVLLSGMLAACGGGGSDGGGVVDAAPQVIIPTPGAQAFTITSSVQSVEPLQRIELAPEAAATDRSGYTVQMDVRGTSNFAPADTVELPGLVQNGVIIVAAPPLEMARPSATAGVPGAFHLRVKRISDGRLSQVLRISYERLEIPASRKGAPSTLLQLAMKAIMIENGGVLATRAAKIMPGQLSATSAALSTEASLADIQAEAILRHVFGFTTLQKAIPAQSTARALSASVRPLGPSDGIKAGMQRIFDCMESHSNGGFSDETGDRCLNVATRFVRDDYIPNIEGVVSRVTSGASVITGLVGRGLSGFVGRYVDRMVVSSEMTGYVSELAQIALTVPDVVGDPNSAADLAFDKLTQLGKRKLYDYLVGGLSDIGQQALNVVGAPDAFEAADLSGISLDKLRQVGESLSSLPLDAERLKDLPAEFGGDDQSLPASIQFGTSSLPISGQTPTAASLCAENPGIASGVASLGFGSCEDYVRPFLDPVYFSTVLQPIFSLISASDLAQIQACTASPDTPACMALFDRVAGMSERIMAAISSFKSKQYGCDGGYAKYENSYGGLTCVYAALVAPRSGGACVPGSHAANFDAGSSDICVYFTRDYIQKDNSCRPNYARVTFDGRETCRWIGLPSPAVYSVNVDTGDRASMVP